MQMSCIIVISHFPVLFTRLLTGFPPVVARWMTGANGLFRWPTVDVEWNSIAIGCGVVGFVSKEDEDASRNLPHGVPPTYLTIIIRRRPLIGNLYMWLVILIKTRWEPNLKFSSAYHHHDYVKLLKYQNKSKILCIQDNLTYVLKLAEKSPISCSWNCLIVCHHWDPRDSPDNTTHW